MVAKRSGPSTVLAVALVLVSAVSVGHASVMIHITESGSDLVVTTSGSADTTGWGPPGGTVSNSPRVRINTFTNSEFIAFGVGTQDWWDSPGVGSFTFTDNGLLDVNYAVDSLILTSGGGDVGFSGIGLLLVWLPTGYVSGTPINQVLTISGESFASIGVEDGDTATISWAGSNPDSITMAIGSGVPVELQSFIVE